MNNKVSPIKRRRFLLGARTVSIGIEPYLWDCLRDISEREDMDIPAILAGVNRHFHEPRLSDKTRSFIWQYYRRAARADPQSCGHLERALDFALPL